MPRGFACGIAGGPVEAVAIPSQGTDALPTQCYSKLAGVACPLAVERAAMDDSQLERFLSRVATEVECGVPK